MKTRFKVDNTYSSYLLIIFNVFFSHFFPDEIFNVNVYFASSPTGEVEDEEEADEDGEDEEEEDEEEEEEEVAKVKVPKMRKRPFKVN